MCINGAILAFFKKRNIVCNIMCFNMNTSIIARQKFSAHPIY